MKFPAVSRTIKACNHACRVIAVVTAGEAVALFHSAAHMDFVTAYLALSAWIKDRVVKHVKRRAHKAIA